MTSTTDSGNEFRDFVGSMLAAAGFKPVNEVRLSYKKVDVVWERYGVDGRTRYLVECKNYAKTLTLAECREFKEDYRDLIENGDADYAWLISKSDISPDARKSIDLVRGLKCFTFSEFQRRLYGADAYLQNLINSFEASGADQWYVEVFDQNNNSLEKIVRDWVVEKEAPPLAFIAGYGKGKSTFANRLASRFATEALRDKTARIPILIPLGSIMDEQSLEGLLGKAFSTNAETYGYNFGLFEKLNEAGSFVIFFDGFDEMKHGMTLAKFEMMIRELMRLDKGNAKLIILGRDTAFHDDVEFRSIIQGRQKTGGGAEVRVSGRREFRTVSIRDFTIEEAIKFIKGFFPAFVREVNRGERPLKIDWIEQRVDEITGESLHSLIVRPVHARMLCQVASDPAVSLAGLSKYGLFDLFLHFLLEREVQKRGRDPQFGIDVRRRINALIALWLWEQGGVSTVSISEIPHDIFEASVAGINHNYDDNSLKRELVQGCLLDKGSEAVFFGHRSLQEFLVADAILNMNGGIFRHERRLIEVISVLNKEILAFIYEGACENIRYRKSLIRMLEFLSKSRDMFISHILADFIVDLINSKIVSLAIFDGTPWSPYITYFMANGRVSYRLAKPEAFSCIVSMLTAMKREDRAFQASTMLIFSLVSQSKSRIEEAVAAWIESKDIERSLERGIRRGQISMTFHEAHDDLPFWLFLQSCRPIWEDSKNRAEILEIDLRQLTSLAYSFVSVGFETAEKPLHWVVRLPLEALYRAWGLTQEQKFRFAVFFSEEFWSSMRANAAQASFHQLQDPIGSAGIIARRKSLRQVLRMPKRD